MGDVKGRALVGGNLWGLGSEVFAVESVDLLCDRFWRTWCGADAMQELESGWNLWVGEQSFPGLQLPKWTQAARHQLTPRPHLRLPPLPFSCESPNFATFKDPPTLTLTSSYLPQPILQLSGVVLSRSGLATCNSLFSIYLFSTPIAHPALIVDWSIPEFSTRSNTALPRRSWSALPFSNRTSCLKFLHHHRALKPHLLHPVWARLQAWLRSFLLQTRRSRSLHRRKKNGSGCSDTGLVKSGRVDLWRHKKWTCHLSISERLSKTSAMCHRKNSLVTSAVTWVR